MTVLQKEKITDKYIMEKPDFFSLDRTLDCGQCFRFEKKTVSGRGWPWDG